MQCTPLQTVEMSCAAQRYYLIVTRNLERNSGQMKTMENNVINKNSECHV